MRRPFQLENWRNRSCITVATCGQLCIILGLCFVSLELAHAQDPEQGPGPALVRGAFSLESSLGIEALYNSNIFQSRTDVQSSPIWRLEPSLLMRYKPARSRLEFVYDGDFGWYSDSSADDYGDHALEAGAYLLLGERSGLDLVASYDYSHEDRGTGLTQGVPPGSLAFPQDPDRYTVEQFLGRYTYGVSRTRAYVALEGSTEKLTYQNNPARTQQFDRDETSGQATFGLRVRPKTSLELRVQARDIQYPNPPAFGPSLDSGEYRYLLGVVWEATAKTTGTVLVGWVDRNFDDPARRDFSDPSWKVDIRWSPRTYSHFDFGSQRYTEEPIDLLGDATLTTTYSLSWSHEWNDRLGSKIAASKVDDTYYYVTGGRREDQSPGYSLALTYNMRPWLRWAAGVDINARNSDIKRYNFERTIARLGAWITF